MYIIAVSNKQDELLTYMTSLARGVAARRIGHTQEEVESLSGQPQYKSSGWRKAGHDRPLLAVLPTGEEIELRIAARVEVAVAVHGVRDPTTAQLSRSVGAAEVAHHETVVVVEERLRH